MFFDHYLAAQWELYHPDSLEEFSSQFYQLMQEYFGNLPDKTKKILPIMSKYNWLLTYQSLEGLRDILFQMSQRTRFVSNMALALVELEKKYSKISLDFNTFFNQLINFVQLEKAKLS